jgi:hypothetical protein
LRPRLPVRCRPPARSGRSVNLARPCGLLITRSASWLSMKRRRDLTTVHYFTSRCYDVASALAGLKPISGGFAAQSTLTTPPHGMRRGRQTEALCACSPLRFQPPMAMDDRGLACPVSVPTVSRNRRISPPAPSTTGLLTDESIYQPVCFARGRGRFSPLSTVSVARKTRERRNR